MRLAAAALAVCAALLAGPLRAEEDVVSLSLDQAVIVAQQAVLAGDAGLGYAIARRLVEADPANARAQLIIAATAPALGLPADGRKAGRTAWGLTRDPGLRYEIARHTAKAAYVEGRPQATQFWLRRAADIAPSQAHYDQTVQDVGQVRDAQRLRFALDVSVSPSDNLNNGARGGLLTIDDSFTVGPLSPDAQAVSGLRVVGQAQLNYRLGPAGRTLVGVRGYGTLNRLSSEAREQVNGLLTGSNLNILQLEGTFAHTTQWPGGTWPLMVKISAGNTWGSRQNTSGTAYVSGQNLGAHLRIEASMPLSRKEPTRLTLTGEVQQQDDDAVTALAMVVDGKQVLGAGQLSWRLGLRQTDGPRVNNSYAQISSDIGYAFGRPVGPVTLTLRAGGAIRDYPEYSLVVANVTGGRQDRTASVGLDAAFEDLSVLGYVPRISLTATETHSNISRFETREVGVSFGIQSRF